MTRGDPQFAIVDIRRDHFLVASLAILSSDEVHQSVVDVGTMGEEKTAARTQFVEEEEILLTTQLAMISLSSLFLVVLPFLELFGIRE